MALSITQTAAMQRIIKPGMRVASMGYPDLIAPIEPMPGLEYRKDSEAICKRHGLKPRQIPDAHSYFKALGCGLDVFDIVQERGDEILCDLNHSIERAEKLNVTSLVNGVVTCYRIRIKEAFDIVLDVGTAEHCFNIGQALINMAGLVKDGGHIIHENPFNCGNHGFYSLNPTLFVDFYEANGFEVLECRLADRTGASADAPRTDRFRFVEAEVNTFCLAKRVKVQPFVFPTQTKYRKIYAAAGLSGDTKEKANA